MKKKNKHLLSNLGFDKSNQKWWYCYDRTNPYFRFIENYKIKNYSKEKELHLHHILPKHLFDLSDPEEQLYCESEENKIYLSIEDHITAHLFFYAIYKHPQDKGAVLLLTGQMNGAKEIWRQLGAKATHGLLKVQGRNFWSLEFQKEMADRSMTRSDALEIRSRGGKVGGRVRNLNRVIAAKDRYLFYYKNQPVLCVFNCETGGDVVRILQSYSEKEKCPGRVSGLLDGSRKSLYGWSCEKI